MSVIVKGMDVPSDCDGCWHPKCNLWHQTDVGKRHKDCPISPMPEKHGRLIDEGALRDVSGMGYSCEDCKQNVWDCSYNQAYTRMDFCGWLDGMETIVEAEGDAG